MSEVMQTLRYNIGPWQAEARLAELGAGNLMAVICVTDGKGNVGGSSKHTVVFEHRKGKNAHAEIAALVRALLRQQRRV
jgi:hypothetical protein